MNKFEKKNQNFLSRILKPTSSFSFFLCIFSSKSSFISQKLKHLQKMIKKLAIEVGQCY